MKIAKTSYAAVSLVAAGGLLVAGCGSNADRDGGASSNAPAAKVDGIACAGKPKLRASGSTAQENAVKTFANSYAKTCDGASLDYTGNGSGKGVTEFTGRLTDFGGTDSPLKDAEYTAAKARCGSDAWNLPLVFGPIAVTYNVDGATNVALSGPTLAKIFAGEITKWNDPVIAAENKGAALPDEAITVLYRSDESGTTDNFQKYLGAASDGVWTKGDGKKFNGGVGEGKDGNPGVAAGVKATKGSISYTEWSFAKKQGLSIATIITSAGPEAVELTAATAAKTIEGATLKNGDASHDLVLDTSSFYKPKQAGAYPIILATYEVVCSTYADAETGKAVKSFLKVAASAQNQGQGLSEQGYVPLPASFLTKLNAAIDAIA